MLRDFSLRENKPYLIFLYDFLKTSGNNLKKKVDPVFF